MGVLAPSAMGERLVDPRTGLIKHVERHARVPGSPRSYVVYGARVAATNRFAPWLADRFSCGESLVDDAVARAAAIGEAVERYCGSAVPGELLTASFDALRRTGRRALDPLELCLYSSRQHATPGFPFVPLTRELEIAWVPARDLITGEEELVPASLVYLNYYSAVHADEPHTNLHVFGGIAAGPTAGRAERSALEELFERDATTIWWMSGTQASRIDDAEDPALGCLLAEPQAAGLDVSLLTIPSPFGVPVIGAFLEDAERSLVGFGVACRAAGHGAAGKALTEAMQMHSLALELLDPDSSHWTMVRAGLLGPAPHKSYRADRAYRVAFRDDWRDATDLLANAQIYLDPCMHGEPLRRLRPPVATTRMRDLPAIDERDAREAYLARLSARGLRALAVDLTTSDVLAAGLRVVRIVVPGLYGNAPAAFPLLGGRRLYEEPASQGRLAGTIDEDDLVLHPLPYS
jgi:ribosomal protein S12 methylthiotransferase accessory factor